MSSTDHTQSKQDVLTVVVKRGGTSQYYGIGIEDNLAAWHDLGLRALGQIKKREGPWHGTEVSVRLQKQKLFEDFIPENASSEEWGTLWAKIGEEVRDILIDIRTDGVQFNSWQSGDAPAPQIEVADKRALPPNTNFAPTTGGGTKHDQGKPMFGLIPQNALLEVAKAVTFGAIKYTPENWKQLENLERRFTDAALRHTNAYLRGVSHDPETGLHHLAHAIVSLMFVLDTEITKGLANKRQIVVKSRQSGKTRMPHFALTGENLEHDYFIPLEAVTHNPHANAPEGAAAQSRA